MLDGNRLTVSKAGSQHIDKERFLVHDVTAIRSGSTVRDRGTLCEKSNLYALQQNKSITGPDERGTDRYMTADELGDKPEGPLRRGWTTGTCATAAATAAYEALLTDAFPEAVTVLLPRGGTATLPLVRTERADGWASAGVIKDAGDDPDVTHGAEVVATVAHGPAGSGVTFRAGEGVGVVTLPGLPVPVGEPAINPSPRQMIRDALSAVADHCGVPADAVVTVSIPGGERLAEKTLNGRLGIQGGLSVLGTTGIVVPFSCAAWVHSIHRGIDVARASGIDHVAAATGSTSEAAVRKLYDLPDQALIDMGDFVGGMLKYMRKNPLPRLSVAGGFAKMAQAGPGQPVSPFVQIAGGHGPAGR